MAVCHACKKRYLWRGLNRRLAVPEYRSMTGFWPWVGVQVCDGCLEGYERNFLERLRLLAPDVLENDEPIVGEVCLACGTLAPGDGGPWQEASKWAGPDGRAVRRARFRLCPAHRQAVYIEGVVAATNLADESRMRAVLGELPTVGGELLERVEHWRPEDGRGPPGAEAFVEGMNRHETAAKALDFWQGRPEGLVAKAAWLGPVRKEYRMRYRLDLVREDDAGRRDAFSIIRLGDDRFAAYRTAQPSGS